MHWLILSFSSAKGLGSNIDKTPTGGFCNFVSVFSLVVNFLPLPQGSPHLLASHVVLPGMCGYTWNEFSLFKILWLHVHLIYKKLKKSLLFKYFDYRLISISPLDSHKGSSAFLLLLRKSTLNILLCIKNQTQLK